MEQIQMRHIFHATLKYCELSFISIMKNPQQFFLKGQLFDAFQKSRNVILKLYLLRCYSKKIQKRLNNFNERKVSLLIYKKLHLFFHSSQNYQHCYTDLFNPKYFNANSQLSNNNYLIFGLPRSSSIKKIFQCSSSILVIAKYYYIFLRCNVNGIWKIKRINFRWFSKHRIPIFFLKQICFFLSTFNKTSLIEFLNYADHLLTSIYYIGLYTHIASQFFQLSAIFNVNMYRSTLTNIIFMQILKDILPENNNLILKLDMRIKKISISSQLPILIPNYTESNIAYVDDIQNISEFKGTYQFLNISITKKFDIEQFFTTMIISYKITKSIRLLKTFRYLFRNEPNFLFVLRFNSICLSLCRVICFFKKTKLFESLFDYQGNFKISIDKALKTFFSLKNEIVKSILIFDINSFKDTVILMGQQFSIMNTFQSLHIFSFNAKISKYLNDFDLNISSLETIRIRIHNDKEYSSLKLMKNFQNNNQNDSLVDFRNSSQIAKFNGYDINGPKQPSFILIYLLKMSLIEIIFAKLKPLYEIDIIKSYLVLKIPKIGKAKFQFYFESDLQYPIWRLSIPLIFDHFNVSRIIFQGSYISTHFSDYIVDLLNKFVAFQDVISTVYLGDYSFYAFSDSASIICNLSNKFSRRNFSIQYRILNFKNIDIDNGNKMIITCYSYKMPTFNISFLMKSSINLLLEENVNQSMLNPFISQCSHYFLPIIDLFYVLPLSKANFKHIKRWTFFFSNTSILIVFGNNVSFNLEYLYKDHFRIWIPHITKHHIIHLVFQTIVSRSIPKGRLQITYYKDIMTVGEMDLKDMEEMKNLLNKMFEDILFFKEKHFHNIEYDSERSIIKASIQLEICKITVLESIEGPVLHFSPTNRIGQQFISFLQKKKQRGETEKQIISFVGDLYKLTESQIKAKIAYEDPFFFFQ